MSAGHDADRPDRPDRPGRPGRLLEASGIGLVLSGTTVLHGVDLVVAPGEVLALVGPSGSGKSSLLYCLSGLVRPTAGEVRLGGERVSGLGADAAAAMRRRHLGFVFQSSELVPELTLRENVALPLQLIGRPRREALREAAALLERLDLTDRADARPARVSGGQAQRAAIARAVVHRPDVVFADEPTGALDSRSSAVALEALTSLARAHGSSVVLVTHDAEVATSADRVVELHDGRLVGPVVVR